MGIIINKNINKEKRRFLRTHMTEPEIILWSKLQKKQQFGYRFLRQYGIGSFVIDFYCPKLKLAIEIDGKSHSARTAKVYDKEREEGIKEYGLRFLRFKNEQVLFDLKNVILVIRKEIRKFENNPRPDKIGTSPLRN